MDQASLDKALLAAHDAQDSKTLVDLYTLAGDQAEGRQDIGGACFYLTHALVFALETGATQAAALNKRLVDHGRAHPINF